MKKKTTYLLFFLIILFSFTAFMPDRPKCPTCGKYITVCTYKGKHPTPQQPVRTCSQCGRTVSSCIYGGFHPQCNTCGRTIAVSNNACQYSGNHPLCSSCGRLIGASVNACGYRGSHPICSSCHKTIGASANGCEYNGNHPVAPALSATGEINTVGLLSDGRMLVLLKNVNINGARGEEVQIWVCFEDVNTDDNIVFVLDKEITPAYDRTRFNDALLFSRNIYDSNSLFPKKAGRLKIYAMFMTKSQVFSYTESKYVKVYYDSNGTLRAELY